MDSPLPSQGASDKLPTSQDITNANESIRKQIGPRTPGDIEELTEYVIALWNLMKTRNFILNSGSETDAYALNWYKPESTDTCSKIYYHILGHPIYNTELSIAEFIICGLFNSSNSVSDLHYNDNKSFNKFQGFTCDTNLECTDEECIIRRESKNYDIYTVTMNMDGLEGKIDDRKISCKYGDIQSINSITTGISPLKMVEILKMLKIRRNLIQSNNYLTTSVSRDSVSIRATSYININKFVQDIIKYTYICFPDSCESYRLSKVINSNKEDDVMVKYWKKLKDLNELKNCIGMLYNSHDPIPIGKFIFALLVDILCVYSVATFV
jgi:hypothetical protein